MKKPSSKVPKGRPKGIGHMLKVTSNMKVFVAATKEDAMASLTSV